MSKNVEYLKSSAKHTANTLLCVILVFISYGMMFMFNWVVALGFLEAALIFSPTLEHKIPPVLIRKRWKSATGAVLIGCLLGIFYTYSLNNSPQETAQFEPPATSVVPANTEKAQLKTSAQTPPADKAKSEIQNQIDKIADFQNVLGQYKTKDFKNHSKDEILIETATFDTMSRVIYSLSGSASYSISV